jgi:hypothetical protein
VWPEGLGTFKEFIDLIIEIVTFRFVTLVPQSLRYRVPLSPERGLVFTLVLEEECCFISVGRTDILLMSHDLDGTTSALS